jgi:hypothetical protein
MDALLADARQLFESAQAGSSPTDIAIAVGYSGAIRIVNAEGWALSSLQTEMGAQRVYRIKRDSGQVQLEGRSLTSQCTLRSEEPAKVARRLLAATTPIPALSLLPEAGTAHGAARNPCLLLMEARD